MSKLTELGRVTVKHPSGIVETDQKHKVTLATAKIGDRLVMDERRKVTVSDKKSDTIDPSEYNTLNQVELADKYKVTELKSIAKSEGMSPLGTTQGELCEYIAKKFDNFIVDETGEE